LETGVRSTASLSFCALKPGFLVIGATLVAYQPVWHAGFIWDDDGRLINNPLTGAADD
jgi:hypothetical protein